MKRRIPHQQDASPGIPNSVEAFLGRCQLFDYYRAQSEEFGLDWPDLQEQWGIFQLRRHEAERAQRGAP